MLLSSRQIRRTFPPNHLRVSCQSLATLSSNAKIKDGLDNYNKIIKVRKWRSIYFYDQVLTPDSRPPLVHGRTAWALTPHAVCPPLWTLSSAWMRSSIPHHATPPERSCHHAGWTLTPMVAAVPYQLWIVCPWIPSSSFLGPHLLLWAMTAPHIPSSYCQCLPCSAPPNDFRTELFRKKEKEESDHF